MPIDTDTPSEIEEFHEMSFGYLCSFECVPNAVDCVFVFHSEQLAVRFVVVGEHISRQREYRRLRLIQPLWEM
jgi:hypothetical protein